MGRHAHFDLFPRPPGERDECVLGRSPACDVVISPWREKDWVHSMISNRHCRLWPDGEGTRAYLEDCSANGTVVKEVGGRTTLLKRGERAVLRTGDEICLINHVSARGALGIPLTRCSSC